MRRIWLAIFIALLIQSPFLILMNGVGVHSALGGVWVIFYLPAIWLLDRTGIPNMSQFMNVLMIALFQDVILVILILSFMTLSMRVKPIRNKAS